MTEEEFDFNYPLILAGIKQTIAKHISEACIIASLGFKRLPQYFSPDFLAYAKVVYLETVPMPRLKEIGLDQFSEFKHRKPAGITYLDTFFSRTEMRGDEAHHFHELIHILQWKFMGPKSFIAAYAEGLERIGYRKSPLEVMAYTLESVFKKSTNPFDVAAVVREELTALYSAG